MTGKSAKFSDTLASALQTKLKRLLGNEPRLGERIDVHSLNAIGLRLFKAQIGQVTIASPARALRRRVHSFFNSVDEEMGKFWGKWAPTAPKTGEILRNCELPIQNPTALATSRLC